MRKGSPPRHSGINFEHPTAFWLGTLAVGLGVLAHIPDFIASGPMGYHMSGMPMSPKMQIGMILIVAGLGCAAFGLIPIGAPHRDEGNSSKTLHFGAMDSATLSRQHWALLFILGVALVVDVMKPATLGFVMPGMKAEYGLTTAQVSLLLFVALTGTAIGSIVWGVMSDRIGRRAAILLASILFMGTSICGFMPSLNWNLFMCFMMGLSAGGMLPIVYTLMTESMPAKRRGWIVVLHGGLGTIGGYLVASGLATFLEPHYTWRILWFAGLPTGLLLLLLNRSIPESPRFLIEKGRVEEAETIMRRFGIVLTEVDAMPSPVQASRRTATKRQGFFQLFQKPYLIRTLCVGTYGLGWGLVNFGFLTFAPTILRDRGLDGASASRLLFWSAVIALPATLVVAYLYGKWSSRLTMVLFALITAGALVAFAIVDPGANGQRMTLVMPLMVLLLAGSGGVISMLSPYTAEVYPTSLRGTGSGLAAGSSKVGGIIAPPVAALVLSFVPGFTLIASVVAVPVLLSAVILGITGVETRDKPLEELSGSSLDVSPALVSPPSS